MTPREIEESLESITILIDTREQDTARLRARIRQMACNTERCKLDYGDYSAKVLLDDKWLRVNTAVERKMDFAELAQCYCKGRGRFAREFERAKAVGAKIYLLVENQSWEDAYSGNYRTQMSAKSFVASMLSWLARYNCQLILCEQRTSGKLIHDILYYEAREMLERMMLDEG